MPRTCWLYLYGYLPLPSSRWPSAAPGDVVAGVSSASPAVPRASGGGAGALCGCAECGLIRGVVPRGPFRLFHAQVRAQALGAIWTAGEGRREQLALSIPPRAVCVRAGGIAPEARFSRWPPAPLQRADRVSRHADRRPAVALEAGTRQCSRWRARRRSAPRVAGRGRRLRHGGAAARGSGICHMCLSAAVTPGRARVAVASLSAGG